MKQTDVQDGGEGNILPRLGLEREPVRPRGGDDELFCTEERTEVLVEVLLFLSGLTVRGRPELHGVGGDAHVFQTRATDDQQEHTGEDHRAWSADAEGTPGAEEVPEEALETLAKRLAARHFTCRTEIHSALQFHNIFEDN